MIGRTLGHYEIVSELGAGGMGVVYKARDTHLDRFVAIKVLPPDAVADADRTRRFVQEAKAASALKHPNIVTIHDIAHAGDVEFIVMEYVEGQTLDRLIPRGGMKLGDLLRYARQAADALARAHAAGIVHRDLKPSNIMITPDGHVKILDFGLAKLAPAHAESADTVLGDQVRTGQGVVIGTPAYMSPEQAEGKPVDGRSDIFSLGAVLYEMATGTSPFRGESTASTLAAVLTSTPPAPSQAAPHVPRELERVIVRCLRKDASRRFQVMSDLVVELEEVETESGERIAAAAPAARRTRRWAWSIGGVVAVLALLAAAVLWRPTAEIPAAPPALVTLTSYQGVEEMPSLSFDGSEVAFVWNSERQDNFDIYVKPIDTVTPLRLTTDPLDDLAPAWSPSARLIAFLRILPDGRGAVYVTPPIPGSERRIAEVRRGTPTAPANRTDTAVTGQGAPSWTPDGRWLAVAALGPGDEENGLFLIASDAGERRTLVTAPVGTTRLGRPVVSPSGRELAYLVCAPRSQVCDIWLQPLASDFSAQGDARRATTFGAIITGLVWTPDSGSIVASVTASQGALNHLWRVPVAGGAPTRLDWAGSSVWSPTISGNGRLAVASDKSSTTDIWRFDLSAPSLLPRDHPVSSTLQDVDPDFSPDGSTIAFASTRSGQDQEIWVATSDGAGLRQITRGANGRNRGTPRWSPDGTRLVFDSPNEVGLRTIFVVDATGGDSRSVSGGHGNWPIWSPDGQWIYFGSNRSGRVEVWRVPAAGGDAKQVTVEGGTGPRVSADGRTLFYRRGTTIFSMAAAGGPERAIIEHAAGSPSAYDIHGGEIYYLTRPDASRLLVYEMRATDPATGRTRSITQFEGNQAQGLTIAPDGKTALLSVFKAGSDLVLIENFR